MKKSVKKLFRLVALLGALAVVSLGLLYYAFYAKAVDNEADVYVSTKSEYSDIEAQLYPQFRSTLHRKAFDIYAARLGLSKRFRTGYYKFSEGESVIRIARRLVLGEQTPVKLVVRTARTLPQLAGRLASQIDADSVDMLKALRDDKIRKELGFVRDSTIAMFIPNTYEVYWNTTPEALMHRMKREYNAFWNADRTAKLKRCKMSKYEVMTLASIVYEEVKIQSEMLLIAGVYINRLRRGIPLGACPTVKYAIGDFELRRILYKHLKYQSPFNTYINKGLPPAPICIPSVTAIDAVLNHPEHDYLFFCARPEFDGKHNFARNLAEHNANARRYAEALERRGIK